MKKKVKNLRERGITLIALVVTIIIMLILAGVTLYMALGDNGLIGYAKQARTEYNKKATEEDSTLQGYTDFVAVNFEKWKQSEDGSEVTRGSVTLKIGDYVNYTPDGEGVYSKDKLTESYTGDINNKKDITREGLKWRVLGVDTNGCLTLISDKPTSGTLWTMGAEGYNNGVYILNDICKTLYSNSELGVTARSLTIEDIEGGLSEIGLNARNEYTSDGGVKYNNTTTYETRSRYPVIYAQEKGSGINGQLKADGIGQSDSYYSEKDLTSKQGKKNNGECDTTEKISCTQTFYKLSNSKENFKNQMFCSIIFPEDSDGYGLATRYVSLSTDYAEFGLFDATHSRVVLSSQNGHRP